MLVRSAGRMPGVLFPVFLLALVTLALVPLFAWCEIERHLRLRGPRHYVRFQTASGRVVCRFAKTMIRFCKMNDPLLQNV